jgi:PIN domain nuclease of toxin-antitoxin system
MNLLLDTHILIWWLQGSRQLGKKARNTILRPNAQCWISVASIWEMAIKSSINKLRLTPEECIPALLEQGFRALPIAMDHAFAVRTLPPIHSDPFDRMLIAQARFEGLTIVTADPAIAAYDVRTVDASA